jgi:hypothetical protein
MRSYGSAAREPSGIEAEGGSRTPAAARPKSGALRWAALKGKKPNSAVEAVRLLGKWTRLSQGHVSLSAGCSCGLGFAAVKVQDYEQDILDFLSGKHGAAVAAASSIEELLRTLAASSGQSVLPVLKDLERSIDSFEEQHR